MDITDIATEEFIEVDDGERLGKVRSIFEEENPKGIVVTDDGEYTGVITQKQLLQSHIEDHTKAGALARPAPQVDRREDIRDTARMLVEGNTKVAPVFEGDSLWGIVTVDAILVAVLDSLDAITVGDIYTDDPITATEDTTVGRVINLMREHGISRLPIVDDSGYLGGIVTTNDVVDVVVRAMDKTTVGDRSGENDRMLDLPVYDEMSTPVETVSVDATVEDAVRTMLDRGFAGLVVTGDDDRVPQGVVTKTDVLRALSFTEEEHLDVQITNIDLLDTISRQEIRETVEAVADKYSKMQVQHAHVRFHKHKEKLRGTPLIRAQIRLRTNRGQAAGSGEGYGAEAAFYVAVDTLERNVLEMKGIEADEEYRGQLLRKLGEI
jgi:CBS domain-containing protein/ribosome-associated translation inhibitor RaiA